MKIKFYFAFLTLLIYNTANAQQKIKDGSISGSSSLPHPGAILELESNNKGQLLPRVSLTNTTIWGLSGTTVTGMQVYNINNGISPGNAAYPVHAGSTVDKNGLGIYSWDGAGWVASRIPASTINYYDWLKSGDNLPITIGDNSAPIYHQSGNVGIGNNSPSHPLHVTATANPVRLQGLAVTTNSSDKIVVADNNGVLKLGTSSAPATIAVGVTAVVSVPRLNAGSATLIPNDALVINTIPGATYNVTTNAITIPAGTYLIQLSLSVGQFSAAGTTIPASPIHSYFYDFPGGIRIHANQPTSNTGLFGSHGANMTYTAQYTTARTLYFNLGWGQGGNMPISSTIQLNPGTQLSVTRIAD